MSCKTCLNKLCERHNIRSKCKWISYPTHFISSVTGEFTAGKENGDNELIIPPWIFKVKKNIFLIEILHCFKNENSYKWFIKKFD